MSNSVKFSIDGDTNAEQVAGRAKAAVGSLDKQLEGIGNKFKTSFKDIFLSFLGPMALLGVAINYIGNKIAENQRKHAEANQAAIDGTNELISAEDRYWAKKREGERKLKEDQKQAAMSREDITKDFLINDPLGRAYVYKKQGGEAQENLPYWLKKLRKMTGSDSEAAGLLAKSQEAQMFVQTALMERRRDNPLEEKTTGFKGPEGFSNVVGVGANPVIDAMNAQLEEAQKQTALLEKIASPEGGVPKDFTKDSK